MSDDSQRPIVIKRIKKGGHGHHGGAWKIAYADFVTAMMAFFLLMWLLGSATKGDLRGISDYFQNPLKVALNGGSGAGNSTSIFTGGGLDITHKAGQKRGGETNNERLRDQRGLQALKKALENAINHASAKLGQYKDQIKLDITPEGLRIQIVDKQNRPMFKTGSAQMEPYADEILREISSILNAVPNRVSLSGHTDSANFASGQSSYSNWELSADRANASRRALIAGGMNPAKVLRVVGLADAVPYDTKNPSDPVNRRISIIVLTKDAEANIMKLAGKHAGDASSPTGDASATASDAIATTPAPTANPDTGAVQPDATNP